MANPQEFMLILKQFEEQAGPLSHTAPIFSQV
jgi:hypothetical protein